MKLIEIGELDRAGNLVRYPDKIEHLIKDDTFIGRDEQHFLSFENLKLKYTFLKINHRGIARIHTIVSKRDGYWWIEDSSTTNGTWFIKDIAMPLSGSNLIQSKIDSPIQIKSGDYFLIAFVVITFTY